MVSYLLRKHSKLPLSRNLKACIGMPNPDVMQVSVCELKEAALMALEVGVWLGQGPRPVVLTTSAGSPHHHQHTETCCRDSGLTCRPRVGSMRCELPADEHLPGDVIHGQHFSMRPGPTQRYSGV